MVTNNSCNYDPTQYNVQTGGASGALNNVAPSSTSGIPLVSNGSSSQPSFTTAVVAGGGTGITSATAYSPICAGTTTTGNFQAASTGLSTSGNIFASNGSSSLPSFQTPQSLGASMVLISTQTASASSAISFTSIPSTYKNFVVTLSNVKCTTGTNNLEFQFSSNNGSSYLNSNYIGGFNYWDVNSNAWSNANATTFAYVGPSIPSGTPGISGSIYFYNLTNSAYPTWTGNLAQHGGGASGRVVMIGGYYSSATTMNALQFFFNNSDTIASGTFSLYGFIS